MTVRLLRFLVEGQTEDIFVKDVLAPYYEEKQVWAEATILTTKKAAGGKAAHRGGVSNWAKMRGDIERMLNHPHYVVTTLVDYYALPPDVPGMASRPAGSPYDRVAHVEAAMAEAIGNPRFVPHVVLHETETWVLAACETLGEWTSEESACGDLKKVVEAFASPELVNDGPDTAPSKRILKAVPRYNKVMDGPLVMSELGVAGIRAACPHAHERLSAVEAALGL